MKLAADGAKPRHKPSWVTLPSVRMGFLGHAGEYDIWWDDLQDCFTVVAATAVEKGYTFTDFFLDDGNLEPEDNDVEPDPYHMCLIYQLIEASRATWDPAKEKDQ